MFRCAGAILGCLVGAGFASGQEVLQFFTAFGPLYGALGAILCMAVLCPVAVRVLAAPAGQKVLGGAVFQKLLGPVCFAVYTVMLAGAGALLQTAIGLPPVWGRTLLCVLSLWTVLAGTDRLTRILGYLGPVIVAFALVVGVAAIVTRPRGIAQAAALWPFLELPRAGRCWWLTALNYGGYNAFLLVPLLQILRGQFASGKNAARSAGAGCLCFGVAVLLLHLGLCSRLPAVYRSQTPALLLVSALWPGLYAAAAAGVLLLAGVYTTAVPLLLGVCKPQKMRYCLVAVAAWGCAALPFGTLVNCLYPLVGWLGLALAASLVLTGGKA